MREKGNCPGAATPGQQMEMESFGEATFSIKNHTTTLGEIARFLSPGRENAVPLKELEALTGWGNRDIRKAIERERRGGIPICSDNASGYYLPATQEEKDGFVRSMRHRAREIMRTADAIEGGQVHGK